MTIKDMRLKNLKISSFIFFIIFSLLVQNNGFSLMKAETMQINSLEPIVLGNVKQWIYITGTHSNNPILLIIHGGPGFAMLPLFHQHNSDLEKYFTIVNWDQRGAGRSYSSRVPPTSLSIDQLIADGHELTEKLLKRFGQKKLFILGHSTGSIIGLLLIKRYPEDYYAYIGVGQVINFAENEQLSYAFALKYAKITHNRSALKELKRIGPPDSNGDYQKDDGYDITAKWIEYFGGELHKTKNIDKIYDEIFNSNIYKKHQNQLLKGYQFSELLFDNGIRDFDAEKQALTIDIPVYLFSGKYDYDTPKKLVKRYYINLKAPTKRFVTFKHSAHFPFYEESQLFNNEMIYYVLPNSKQP